MIYAVHWANTNNRQLNSMYASWFPTLQLADYNRKTVNRQESLATQIKESKDDSFTFIITGAQEPDFEKWIKDFNLEEYIMYKQPYQVTNPVHSYKGRNLRLYVLQSKNHFQQELAK